jgi:hypothetical protein
MASSSIEDQIRQASSRNAELLATLARTDYAPPALAQQREYIRQVEGAVALNAAQLKKLASSREKEYKEHKTYSESVTRRFLYKASGNREKFTAKAEKEEKEYFEALQAEQRAQHERQQLEAQLGEARRAEADLQPAEAEHKQAQKDLDSLYQSIFAGPTPSFPDEDAQENKVQQELQEYQRLKGMAEAEDQVINLLTRATRAMYSAHQSVQEALSHSRMDMFGGGTLSDMMERNALNRADMATAEVYRCAEQAQSLSPHVEPLPGVSIAQGSLMSDVLFDNLLTDMNFHNKIKSTEMELDRAAQKLHAIKAAAEQRRSELQQYMGQASGRLSSKRQQLQKVREGIFERMANEVAPPAYSA